MKHATHCKFCHKPITVSIDDDYAALGDPLKLLPLAACNRCADLRVLRRTLEKKVAILCGRLIFSSGKLDASALSKAKTGLAHWTREYARMIARWHSLEGLCWDEAIVEQLMEKPDTWGDALGRLWTMFKDSQASRQPDLNGV
ncbi:MAG: hypothetical protein WA830_23150 [Candidatus Sulfotelmatobacter sp.]